MEQLSPDWPWSPNFGAQQSLHWQALFFSVATADNLLSALTLSRVLLHGPWSLTFMQEVTENLLSIYTWVEKGKGVLARMWVELCDCSKAGGSDSKESAHSTEDPGLIPAWGRSPGQGYGNPLQYFCLENSMHRGGWWATAHGIRHDWVTTHTSNLSPRFPSIFVSGSPPCFTDHGPTSVCLPGYTFFPVSLLPQSPKLNRLLLEYLPDFLFTSWRVMVTSFWFSEWFINYSPWLAFPSGSRSQICLSNWRAFPLQVDLSGFVQILWYTIWPSSSQFSLSSLRIEFTHWLLKLKVR